MITYAQNFEDVLLARLFSGQRTGFYIDVGAWHPTVHSVTQHFYNLGWHGINIEPIPMQWELFQAQRPHDINLNVGVGDKSGALTFFECSDLTSLSTFSQDQAKRLQRDGHSMVERVVEITTLASVIKQHECFDIDFLKIDVEGFEASVIRGMDFQICRPKVLVVEATIPAMQITNWDKVEAVRNWDEWESILLGHGYVFAHYDGLSRFYVRSENASLAERLHIPPGVHDELEFPEVLTLRSELNALLADRSDQISVAERLVLENKAANEDRSKLLEANTRIAAENETFQSSYEELKTDRQNLLAVNVRLEAENVALRLLSEAALEASRVELQLNVAKLEKARALGATLAEKVALARNALANRDGIISTLTDRELHRKALLAGSADLIYHARKQPNPPSYGTLIPAHRQATGLHVAVDTLEIVSGVSGGVETYMKMLVSALVEAQQSVTLICFSNQLADLRGKFGEQVGYFVVRELQALRLVRDFRTRVSKKVHRPTAGRSMATFWRLTEDLGIDILHSPVQIFSTLDFKLPSVLNMHDLQHLHFPQNFTEADIDARNRLYGVSSKMADALIVSSNFVRSDVVHHLNIEEAKVFTIPVTWDPAVTSGLNNFDSSAARAKYRLPEFYVIYPAQFWPHKNHVRLVQALEIVRNRNPTIDLHLVLTGYRGHTGWPAVERAIRETGLESAVICLDHVPVEHLAGLYKGSLFCVMPSTFEASSYPVIEAQYLGVPAMCSNVTSLPELMRGGAGLLFDPFDVEDIANQMERWLLNPDDASQHAGIALEKVRAEHSQASYYTGLARVYQYAKATSLTSPT